MFLFLVGPTQAAGITAGRFHGAKLVHAVQEEASKLTSIIAEAGNNPTISLKQIPDKNLKNRLLGIAPSTLNMSGKSSTLEIDAKELEQTLSAAKKAKILDKNELIVLQSHVQIHKAFGEIERLYGGGSYSPEKAFGKKIDSAIRSIAAIGEKGTKEDKVYALKYLNIFKKQFQNIPAVNLSLAKNAARLAKLESVQQNDMLKQFMNPDVFAGGDGVSTVQDTGMSPQQQLAAANKPSKN